MALSAAFLNSKFLEPRRPPPLRSDFRPVGTLSQDQLANLPRGCCAVEARRCAESDIRSSRCDSTHVGLRLLAVGLAKRGLMPFNPTHWLLHSSHIKPFTVKGISKSVNSSRSFEPLRCAGQWESSKESTKNCSTDEKRAQSIMTTTPVGSPSASTVRSAARSM